MLEVEAIASALFGPVSFRLEAGRALAVMGPSGCGKSLLLRAIADLDAAEGAVRLDGRAREAVPAPDWRRRVALVPAESGWWDDRVGAHFTERGAQPQALAEPLAALGLPADALDWEVARLSSGEKARLALLRALALRPAVLMLDEPTGALDDAATAAVEALLRRRCAEGLALLLVTHDAGQPERLAAPVLAMRADGSGAA